MREDELGESACAAADIKPALTGGGCQPVQKPRANGAAPPPHHVLVGRGIIERDFDFGHFVFPVRADDSVVGAVVTLVGLAP